MTDCLICDEAGYKVEATKTTADDPPIHVCDKCFDDLLGAHFDLGVPLIQVH